MCFMIKNKEHPSAALKETVRDEILQNRRLIRHRFFLGYAYDVFRHAKFYTVWKSLLAYFRRIRLVAIIIKILSIALTVLQTGTLVLLSTLLFLVLLPILVALMLGILITALIESRKSNRWMAQELTEKQIYILFLSKQENAFFQSNAVDLSQKEGNAVIVVSPYWISGAGLASNRFFCTVRTDGARIFLVRRYYFFMLKKHILNHEKLIYVF